jgi:hypothetical protein
MSSYFLFGLMLVCNSKTHKCTQQSEVFVNTRDINIMTSYLYGAGEGCALFMSNGKMLVLAKTCKELIK